MARCRSITAPRSAAPASSRGRLTVDSGGTLLTGGMQRPRPADHGRQDDLVSGSHLPDDPRGDDPPAASSVNSSSSRAVRSTSARFDLRLRRSATCRPTRTSCSSSTTRTLGRPFRYIQRAGRQRHHHLRRRHDGADQLLGDIGTGQRSRAAMTWCSTTSCQSPSRRWCWAWRASLSAGWRGGGRADGRFGDGTVNVSTKNTPVAHASASVALAPGSPGRESTSRSFHMARAGFLGTIHSGAAALAPFTDTRIRHLDCLKSADAPMASRDPFGEFIMASKSRNSTPPTTRPAAPRTTSPAASPAIDEQRKDLHPARPRKRIRFEPAPTRSGKKPDGPRGTARSSGSKPRRTAGGR